MALVSPNAAEEHGEEYGFNLVSSGAVLTSVGLNLSNKINYTYGSRKWYFVKVD